MSNMRLRGTTRPMTLEENGCCHHPTPLGDDGMLSPNHKTPFGDINRFWVLGVCFLVLGECLRFRKVVFCCGLVSLVTNIFWVHESCWMNGMCSSLCVLNIYPRLFFVTVGYPGGLGSKVFPWPKTAAGAKSPLTNMKGICLGPRKT